MLSAKVKKYKQVVYDAERAAADRSRQAEALLVENAKLRDAVAECSLPAEELEQYKKAHDVVLDQTIEIQVTH